MMVDPTNVAANNIYDRPENATQNLGEENSNNDGRPEAGRTSDVGPAVVNNISAAALETTRAVNAPEQAAEQNKANTVVDGEGKGQNDKPEAAKEQYQKSRLDIVV